MSLSPIRIRGLPPERPPFSFIALVLSAVLGGALGGCIMLAVGKIIAPIPLKIASVNGDKIFSRQAKEFALYDKAPAQVKNQAIAEFLQTYASALNVVAERHNAVLITPKYMLTHVEDYTHEVEEMVFSKSDETRSGGSKGAKENNGREGKP